MIILSYLNMPPKPAEILTIWDATNAYVKHILSLFLERWYMKWDSVSKPYMATTFHKGTDLSIIRRVMVEINKFFKLYEDITASCWLTKYDGVFTLHLQVVENNYDTPFNCYADFACILHEIGCA